MNLYKSLGFDVMVKKQSQMTTLLYCTIDPKDLHEDKEAKSMWNCFPEIKQTPTMDSFARKVVEDIHSINCSYLIVVAFSNGGAYAWDAIQGVLGNTWDATESESPNANLNAKVSSSKFE